MKKLTAFVFVFLFINVSANAETKMADVTGDGMEDEIKIGERTVIVIDGESGERWTIWKGAKEEDYEEYGDCSIIRFADRYGLKISKSWYGTVRGGDLGSSIHYYKNGKWYEMQEKYSEVEYGVKVDAGSVKRVWFELSYNDLLFVHEIEYGGAGGTIVLIDYGIKVTVTSFEKEYYSGVLRKTGESLRDWAAVWSDIETGPLIVCIMFDNSEAEAAYRIVNYHVSVYACK